MSLVNAIQFGLGFLCLILLLLVAESHCQSKELKKLSDDLNRSASELDDISDQVARIAATLYEYYNE